MEISRKISRLTRDELIEAQKENERIMEGIRKARPELVGIYIFKIITIILLCVFGAYKAKLDGFEIGPLEIFVEMILMPAFWIACVCMIIIHLIFYHKTCGISVLFYTFVGKGMESATRDDSSPIVLYVMACSFISLIKIVPYFVSPLLVLLEQFLESKKLLGEIAQCLTYYQPKEQCVTYYQPKEQGVVSFCSQCGARIREGSSFCTACGKKL